MTEEVKLPGGNVGGAWRVGDTVRRQTGPWTSAVHALLNHLQGRIPHIPQVLGFDDRGREILSYLPGEVIDVDADRLSVARLQSLVRWTRDFHAAVASFDHPGPWRQSAQPGATLIGHNDIAPYNACFVGDEVRGIFDWDLSAPSNPLLELGFIAWNCVPMWDADVPLDLQAERLTVIAEGYGGVDPYDIAAAAIPRVTHMLREIVQNAPIDAGMANLIAQGEPARSRVPLEAVRRRLPELRLALR